MFKVIDMFGDDLIVNVVDDQLQFKAQDQVLLFNKHNTLEIKNWLTLSGFNFLSIPPYMLTKTIGEFSMYGCGEFDIILNRDDTNDFINWVNENV